MIMLAITGLYIAFIIISRLTGVPLKTRNKEIIRLVAVANGHDAATPIAPHGIPPPKAITSDKDVKRPQKK